MSMKAFAEKIRPVNIPRGSRIDEPLNPFQMKVLQAVNGSLNWLSSQLRPDLSVQTSMSQQSFPKPTIKDFRVANHAIRHARQESCLGITFKPIQPDKLAWCVTLILHGLTLGYTLKLDI